MTTSVGPESLICQGIAPVRKEYLCEGVACARAAFAVDIRDTAVGGADVAVDLGHPGGGADAISVHLQKKSKKQQKREKREARQAVLCHAFMLGSCKRGAECTFSHDTEAYLQAKLPDLPGTCPFVCLPSCPYGVACRWAGTHAGSNGIKTSVAPDGQAQEFGEARVLKNPCAPQEGAGQPQQLAGAEPAEQTDDDWLRALLASGSGRGTVPCGIERPLNALDKALQQALWKDTVDYKRADGVLAAMGLATHDQRTGRCGDRGRQPPRKVGSVQAQRTQGQGCAPPAMAGTGNVTAQQHASVVRPLGEGEPAPSSKRARRSGSPVANPTIADDVDELEALYADEAQCSLAHGLSLGQAREQAAQANDSPARDEVARHSSALPPRAQVACAKALPHGLDAAEMPCARAAIDRLGANSSAAVYVEGRSPPRERRRLDLAGRTYLAPLTTVGNLPFRRVAKGLGVDVTCGEMALATNLLQVQPTSEGAGPDGGSPEPDVLVQRRSGTGQASEWALLKRHPSEDVFGVQVCGGYANAMARLAQLLDDHVAADFVDVNCGCPIDLICSKQAGSALLTKPRRLEEVVSSMSRVLSIPLTVKIRKGYYDGGDVAHTLVPHMARWGAAAVTLHGRTREQRYSRLADWDYIERCAELSSVPLIGNGDVYSHADWAAHMASGKVATCMVGRAALIKPWIFTEIKEQRVWDISSRERFELLQQFVSHGLEHWGSDDKGVETTRRFLLEWLSFTHRYIPVGVLERVDVEPQMHWRPPRFVGRNDLETLLASDDAADWIAISSMLLGPPQSGFRFTPKHRSHSYTTSKEGNAKDAQDNG